jgi:hypothetical protein
MSSSFGLYFVGFLILIAGLAYGAHLAGVPSAWIAVVVICLLGVAVLKLAKRMQAGTGTGTRPDGNLPRS